MGSAIRWQMSEHRVIDAIAIDGKMLERGPRPGR